MSNNPMELYIFNGWKNFIMKNQSLYRNSNTSIPKWALVKASWHCKEFLAKGYKSQIEMIRKEFYIENKISPINKQPYTKVVNNPKHHQTQLNKDNKQKRSKYYITREIQAYNPIDQDNTETVYLMNKEEQNQIVALGYRPSDTDLIHTIEHQDENKVSYRTTSFTMVNEYKNKVLFDKNWFKMYSDDVIMNLSTKYYSKLEQIFIFKTMWVVLIKKNFSYVRAIINSTILLLFTIRKVIDFQLNISLICNLVQYTYKNMGS